VFKALKVSVHGYFELDTSVDGEPMESLSGIFAVSPATRRSLNQLG